jgi:hypothetical protein
MNNVVEVYSHPHYAPQRVPMGSHKMGHCQIRVNSTSPRLSKVVVVQI